MKDEALRRRLKDTPFAFLGHLLGPTPSFKAAAEEWNALYQVCDCRALEEWLEQARLAITCLEAHPHIDVSEFIEQFVEEAMLAATPAWSTIRAQSRESVARVVQSLSPTVQAVLEVAAQWEKREIAAGEFGRKLLALTAEASQLRERWTDRRCGSPMALNNRILALQGALRAGMARRWTELAEHLQRLARADEELLQALSGRESAA